MLTKSQIEDIYPLAPMQSGMLFHNLQDNQSYIIQTGYIIEGPLSVATFEESINRLVARHEVLRTAFIYEVGDAPLQVVLKERKLEVHFEDIENVADQEACIGQFKRDCKAKGFNLTKDVLMRMSILKLATNKHMLIWTFHHILMDGWCVSVIIDEFSTIYYSLMSKKPFTLSPTVPYKQYITWIKQRDEQQSLSFWKSYLDQYENPVRIPGLGRPGKKQQVFDQKIASHSFDSQRVRQLKAYAQERKVTFNMVIQAIWGIALAKYSDTNDALFGSVVSGRPSEIAGIDTSVGLFINTIPVRVRYGEGTTFNQLIQNLWQESVEAQQHQYLSLANVQKESDLSQDAINSLYVFENYPDLQDLTQDNETPDSADMLTFTKQRMSEQNNYDMTLVAFTKGDALQLRIEYNSEVFEDAPMANMLQHLDHMVYQVLDNDEVLVEDISLLAPADHEEILANCHSELDDSIQYTSIQETFEACVAQHPEAIAIKYYENELTYDEFNKRVNKIAKHLKKEYDLGTNDSVGILLTEPDQMIMAIFAILKTGAAYVPVEEEWPAERKGMVVADAGINLLVTDVVSFLDVSEFYSGNIFLFESFSIEIDDFSDDNLAIASTKDDLAYVMYTSGSTGIPKGIAVEQRSVVSLVRDSSLVSVKTGDRVLQLSNFAFDGSTFDIYAALLNGGTLMLLSKETVLSHALLEKYLAKYQPNITFITTSLFNTLIDLNPQQFSRFDRVHIGGEHLSLAHMMRAFDHQQREGILVNSYGPTEGTTFSNFYEIKSKDAIAQLNTVPIGKPLTNRFAYVLNKDGGLCPYFVPGELHIGGVGLFREYLNNEVLNSEKLIPNPFNAEEKIYKTGDEAMMLPDGNIVYLGRKDEQIKLRGFRIELGEIEGCLMQLPNINNAVALVIKEQDKGDVIVAYYQSTQEVSRELIVGELSRKLPSYMIPGEFIRIDQIPLTRNGKADKKLLATMERGADRKHIAPQNEIEQQLLSIWEEVLKSQEKIGVTDSFFDCGGDSILAIKLVVRMNKAFSTNHNINSVFSNPTIRQFAAFLEEATAGPTMSPMVPVDEASYYEASHGQKRMWLLNKFDDTGSAYNIAVTYEIEGALDQEVFAQAWKALIERHESLRTVFTEIDGEPHQIVQAYGSQYAPHFLNLEGEMGQVIDATVSSIAETALDLENGPLSMAVVLQTSGDNDILCLVFHHIVTDGWSMQVIFQELLKNYQNILYGKWNGQENRPMQYKDYTAWLNSPDNQKAFQEQKDYWLQKFSGEVPTLNLISDYPRPKVKTYNGDVVRFELDAVQTSRLNALGDQTEATLFMQLTAMLHLLLHQYSGQNDIVTGTPNAGRHTEEMESMVGFFLNTLCIRTRLNPDVTYADYLKAVKQEVLDIFNNQFYPFDQLVSDLQLSRDTARSPLFDVMVVLQNQNKVGNISDTQMGGLNLSDYPVERSTSHFDLTFEFSETADGLRGAIIYNTDLFTKQRIEQVAVHFKTLTQLILDNTKARLKDISHIPAAERTQLLETFNDTKRAFPEDKTLLDLFAEQVRQQPDQVALVFEDQEYTFEALNAKSNQYGRSLQQRIKIEAGDLVGILMDRTDHMIISILATLKLGAVYLPLDIEAPAERLKKQLENSGLKGIVTDAAHAALAETLSSNFVVADQVSDLEDYSTEDFKPAIGSDALAYTIFTSGSTGVPKGVKVSHRAIVNRLLWMWRALEFDTSDKVLLKTPVVFDVSVWEIFLPLCKGGQLIVCGKEVMYDMDYLISQIERHGITTVHFVPSILNFFLSAVKDQNTDRIASLRRVVASGEALHTQTVDTFYEQIDIPLFNLYGPTEAAVDVTWFKTKPHLSNIPIGQPIDNVQLLILDEHMKLVSPHVAGELYIAGVCLAEGYLNQPGLTVERFVPNPFDPGNRLYKTGDIGYWTEEGNIQYIGRVDDQVKVNGVRIELGEVENALLACTGIKDATVVVSDNANGQKEMVAYIVGDHTLSLNDITYHLSNRLPRNMMPAQIIQINEIAMTPSGKVDREELKSQQVIEFNDPIIADSSHSEIESLLIALTKQLLGKKRIGKTDNFFHMGGDSIKAIILSNKLLESGYSLKVQDVFGYPEIQMMAQRVQPMDLGKANSVISGIIPLTPIQAEIVERNKVDAHHYCQSINVQLSDEFNVAHLPVILKEIQKHHDALRIVFKQENGQLVQYNNGLDHPLEFVEIDLSDSKDVMRDLNTRGEALHESMNMEEGPLMKVALCTSAEGSLLVFTAHHLIVDAVSWRIILDDIATLYEQLEAGLDLHLPVKTSSYKDWAERLQAYANSPELLAEKALWHEIAGKSIEPIPLDIPCDDNYLGDRTRQKVVLSKDETDRILNNISAVLGLQINDVLVCALATAIKQTFDRPLMAITMEGHGREELFEDININRTVGWFTSAYPVLIDLSDDRTLDEDLTYVNRVLTGIPGKGVGYGVLKYLTNPELKQDIDFNLVSQVSFNYVGQLDQEKTNDLFTLAGLPTGNKMSPRTQSVFHLDISGAVFEGQLSMALSYSTKQYRDETIERLGENYRKALQSVVQLLTREKTSVEAY